MSSRKRPSRVVRVARSATSQPAVTCAKWFSRSRRKASRAACPASVTMQPAGPAVGLVGHPLDQAALHEGGDVPADGRGVGVHEFGERALTQRAEPDQREEQHERRPVAAVVLRGLGLERVHQPHEPRHLLREGAHRGRARSDAGRPRRVAATGSGHGTPNGGRERHARYNPLHGARNQLHAYTDCDPAYGRGAPDRQCDPGVRSWHRPSDSSREEREPHRECPADDLRARLPALTLLDEHRLRRRLDGLRKTRDPQARERQRERIAADVAAAEARIARRRAAVPVLSYPEELPVSARRDDIAAALRDTQVVVVAGETGSGKTTQLPKIALGARPRGARPDRAHPAAPDRRPQRRRADRRGAGQPAGRGRRLQDAVHRPGGRRARWSS